MLKYYFLCFTAFIILACTANDTDQVSNSDADTANTAEITQNSQNVDTVYFAGGCFWCVEAAFEQIKGVKEAVSGYAGGKQANPTYKEVSYGRTDHAEAVMVIYYPEVITYQTLLDIFFTAHDGTQLNRQGPDVGEQYRSAIFYTDETEKKLAQEKIQTLSNELGDEIVTELTPYTEFYKAEEYHQDFEKKNPNQSYIVSVSRPKIEKVAKRFSDILKD